MTLAKHLKERNPRIVHVIGIIDKGQHFIEETLFLAEVEVLLNFKSYVFEIYPNLLTPKHILKILSLISPTVVLKSYNSDFLEL